MVPNQIALIAHDARKDDMVMLIKSHQDRLKGYPLIATQGTGQLITARTGLPVTLLEDGPRGGDQQIAALVVGAEVLAVIFLEDPLTRRSHEPKIDSLLRVCAISDVPLATNLSTASAVLDMLLADASLSKTKSPPESNLVLCAEELCSGKFEQ